MTIKYPDGRTVQGVILSRGHDIVRATLNGYDGVVEFTRLNNSWTAEDFEPVQIEFASRRIPGAKWCQRPIAYVRTDLDPGQFHLLLNSSDQAELRMPRPCRPTASGGTCGFEGN